MEAHWRYSFGYMTNGRLLNVLFQNKDVPNEQKKFDLSAPNPVKNILQHFAKKEEVKDFEKEVIGRDFSNLASFVQYPIKETKLIFMAQSLKIDVGFEEPYWCSAFLYDTKLKQQISSYFNFTINMDPEKMKKDMNVPKVLQTNPQKRTALFTFTGDISSIYWVIYVEKIFQGLGVSHYHKKVTGSEAKKIQTEMESAWSYLTGVRHPLMWTYEPIAEAIELKKEKKVDYKLRTGTLQFNKFYALKGDVTNRTKLAEIVGVQNNNYIKKSQVIQSELTLKIMQATDENILLMNSDILQQKDKEPFKEKSQKEMKEQAQRLREKYNEIMYFHKPYESPFLLHFHHTLLIKLNGARFSHQYHNNIVVKVSLRDGDDFKKQPPLKSVIHRLSRNNEENKNLHHYALSGCTYHQKCPEFFDEIRIDIPLYNIGKNHHLLFEFFHIKSKKPEKTEKNAEEMTLDTVSKDDIGVSVVLLLPNGENFIPDGSHKHFIYKSLPQGYLAKLETLEPYSPKKNFKFSSRLISTILPSDPFVQKFSSFMPCYLEKEQSLVVQDFFIQYLLPSATKATREIRLCSFDKIFPQLPIYLNLLLYAISNIKEAKEIGKENEKEVKQLKETTTAAFYSFLVLSKSCPDLSINYKSDRNEILDQYVHYIFNNPPKATKPIYQAISELWLEFLQGKGDNVNDKKEGTQKVLAQKTSTHKMEVSPSEKKGSRSISIFGLFGSKQTKTEAPITHQDSKIIPTNVETKRVEPKDTLGMAYYLFDIMAKSIALYSQTPFYGSKVKHFFTYLDLQDDELFFNTHHLSGLLHELTKISFESNDLKSQRKLNNYISNFLKNLLSISFQKDFLESKFRANVLGVLYEYIQELDTRGDEKVTLRLKLDFIENLLDLDNLIEMDLKLENRALSRFIVDTLLECLYGENLMDQVDGIQLLYKALVKYDYTKKYQTDEARDSIASIFFPLLDSILQNEDSFTNLQNYIKEKKIVFEFSSLFVHLLINRSPDGLNKWWSQKSELFIVQIIQLLTTCCLSINEHPNDVARHSLKTASLTIIKLLSEQLSERVTTQTLILEEIIGFMVTMIHVSTKDVSVEKSDLIDEDFTMNVFFPALVDLLKRHIDLIISTESSMWKWAFGVLLKCVELPIQSSINPHISECISILTQPYIEKLKSQEEYKLVITEDTEDNIQFQEDGSIKAALLDKLVERLTYDITIENDFPSTFLLTYRSFTKPFILLNKLIQRFRLAILHNPETSDKISLRALNVLKLWMEQYFYDFDNMIVTRLVIFMRDELTTKFSSFAKNLKKTLYQKLISNDTKEESQTIFSQKPDPPILPPKLKILMKKEFSILDWSPKEIARQFTLLEMDLFSKIAPKECLSGAWSKKNKEKNSPNIVALTDRWNLTTQYISSSIMTSPDVRVRGKLVSKFIEIAQELSALQNFHSLTAIIAGLQAVSIHRLKKTWAIVPEDKLDIFKKLSGLVDQVGSYKEMRTKLKEAVPPCIPPLAMYLKDLIFIDDGNRDNVDSKNGVVLINYSKRRHISKAILKLKDYQKGKYNIQVVHHLKDSLLKQILNTKFLNEDQMWENSLKFEPREKN